MPLKNSQYKKANTKVQNGTSMSAFLFLGYARL